MKLAVRFVNPAAQEQSESNALPILEVASVGHCVQDDSNIAAVVPGGSMYVPEGHKLHALDPLVDLYLPLSHAVQSPAVPVYPTLHKQPRRDPLPAAENEFGGQSVQTDSVEAARVTENLPPLHLVHAAEPLVGLYVPGGQSSHKPSCPEKPALHVQLLKDPLPGRESVWLGQRMHCSSAIADDSFEYFPESHNVHS